MRNLYQFISSSSYLQEPPFAKFPLQLNAQSWTSRQEPLEPPSQLCTYWSGQYCTLAKIPIYYFAVFLCHVVKLWVTKKIKTSTRVRKKSGSFFFYSKILFENHLCLKNYVKLSKGFMTQCQTSQWFSSRRILNSFLGDRYETLSPSLYTTWVS